MQQGNCSHTYFYMFTAFGRYAMLRTEEYIEVRNVFPQSDSSTHTGRLKA